MENIVVKEARQFDLASEIVLSTELTAVRRRLFDPADRSAEGVVSGRIAADVKQ